MPFKKISHFYLIFGVDYSVEFDIIKSILALEVQEC